MTPNPTLIATEGALWGSIKAHGFLPDTVLVSKPAPAQAGDAGQFAVGHHALCWIHAERLVHKLDTPACAGAGSSPIASAPRSNTCAR